MVFDGLDLDLASGGLLLLRGANGSGKSSLIRQLAGFVPANPDAITWRGEGQLGLADNLAYIGHQPAVKPYLTVRENLALMGTVFGSGGETDDALNYWALDGLRDVPARFLSEGQKRRLALARLLLIDRQLWLLDEPNTGLDSVNLERLNTALGAHLGRGGMVVMASHVPVDGLAATILDFGALVSHTGDGA